MAAPLLTLLKGNDTVEADLFDRGAGGVEYRLFVNGRFLVGRRFVTRAEAVAHMSAVRSLHRREGWSSLAIETRHIA